jgi:hypothetical protein
MILILRFLISLSIVLTAIAARSAERLAVADLGYVGTFLPPDLPWGSPPNTFDRSWGVVALGRDGRTLYLSGCPEFDDGRPLPRVAEISIPRPTPLGAWRLARAELVRDFFDPTGGWHAKLHPAVGNEVELRGLLWQDDDLHWTVASWYPADGPAYPLHGYGPHRPFRIGYPDYSVHATAGYLCPVPDEYRASVGAPLVAGLTNTAILSTTSAGPALFAFDPFGPRREIAEKRVKSPKRIGWDATRQEVIDSQCLLFYPCDWRRSDRNRSEFPSHFRIGAGANRANPPLHVKRVREDGEIVLVPGRVIHEAYDAPQGPADYRVEYPAGTGEGVTFAQAARAAVDNVGWTFEGADQVTGAVWPVVGGKTAVLFVGRMGMGRPFYGAGADYPYDNDGDGLPDRSPEPYQGNHAPPYVPAVWFYDPEDLLAAQRGERLPHTVLPYSVAVLPIPERWRNSRSYLGGAAFDPERNLLYVVARRSSLPRRLPVVHVFRVGPADTRSRPDPWDDPEPRLAATRAGRVNGQPDWFADTLILAAAIAVTVTALRHG